MTRSEYYARMRALARSVRTAHGLASCKVTRSDLRRIYKVHGIKIDIWRHKFKDLRGAYFRDEFGTTVMVADLPTDPMVFTLAHELKHHLADQDAPLAPCGARNQSEQVEIGAEIFAAELLFPEDDFCRVMAEIAVAHGACRPEHIIRVKRSTGTTLSYQGLVKRAEFLGFAPSGSLPRSGWRVLEEEIFGIPFYKRRRRAQSAPPDEADEAAETPERQDDLPLFAAAVR